MPARACASVYPFLADLVRDTFCPQTIVHGRGGGRARCEHCGMDSLALQYASANLCGCRWNDGIGGHGGLSRVQSAYVPEVAAAESGGLRREPGGSAAVAVLYLPFAILRAPGSLPPAAARALSALRKPEAGADCERPRGRRTAASAEANPWIARLPLRPLPDEVLRDASRGSEHARRGSRARAHHGLGACRERLDNPPGAEKNRR